MGIRFVWCNAIRKFGIRIERTPIVILHSTLNPQLSIFECAGFLIPDSRIGDVLQLCGGRLRRDGADFVLFMNS